MDQPLSEAQLDGHLIQRFNADAKPLSAEALDALRSQLIGLERSQQERIILAVLSKGIHGVTLGQGTM